MITRNSVNGGVTMVIKPDGTKIRWGNNPELPESIDLKITNKCDNPVCAAHCHENSLPTGKHGDTGWILNLIGQCIRGSELAIGGGNPLEHPDLEKFLLAARGRGVYANLTVNANHLDYRIEEWMRRGLINGLGISYDDPLRMNVYQLYCAYGSRIVFHVIAGVHYDYVIEDIFRSFEKPKILILGYKTVGQGRKYLTDHNVDSRIWSMKQLLPSLRGKHVSFDNLAVEQLDVASVFPEEFKKGFMGKDGAHTMYIDGVTKTYSISSTGSRVPCKDLTLKQMFTSVKEKV